MVQDMGSIILLRNPIYVLNPLTARHSELPPFKMPDFHTHERYVEPPKLGDKWLSGFGFEDSKKEFKMVLVIFVARDYEFQIFDNEVLVHTLGSTTWRSKVGVVPDVLHKSDEIVSSTFVNGSLHWITVDKSSLNHGPLLVSFNLGVEEFGSVPSPESNFDKYHCQLGIIEDYLSIVGCTVEFQTDVWIMKKYNVKESWVKQFSIQEGFANCQYSWTHPTAKLIKMRKNGELLFLVEKQYLVAYNTRTAKCRHIQIGWDKKKKKYGLEVYTLVGNLISLKEAFGSDISTKETISAKRKR